MLEADQPLPGTVMVGWLASRRLSVVSLIVRVYREMCGRKSDEAERKRGCLFLVTCDLRARSEALGRGSVFSTQFVKLSLSLSGLF